MKTIIAIDPGTTESAMVIWSEGKVKDACIMQNAPMRGMIRAYLGLDNVEVAIEMIASYGMPVGKEVFETCLWIGRFIEVSDITCLPVRLCYRQQIKLHLCQSPRAKDANVAQALRDKLGQVGTKKNPGPLYGIKSHLWSALAIAVYASEQPSPPSPKPI